ncbi:MAG: ATP synthase F1 subunit gamma [Phycisphaerales bacterium]
MASGTRDIKGRIKAVGNIKRITKTMQMIATARFQAMQKRATDAQAYTRRISEMVTELAATLGSGGDVSHPLLSAPKPPVGRELVLVISSNRGLCGGYNANLLRTAMAQARGKDNIDLEIVGKKAAGYFKFAGIKAHAYHSHITDKPEYADIERLAEAYMHAFTEGKYDSVKVVYTAFVSMSKQEARVTQLLPLEPPKTEAGVKATGPETVYDFSPEPEELLDELLPITVKTSLFQYFNEASVSEQLARMVAMKAATDAAGKMQKSLKRKFNRARQASITTELSEIIAGAAALG